MMSIHDVFSNYLEVSAECRDVTGWSQEALLGCSSAEFVHADDMPIVEEAYARALETRRPMHIVCRIEGRDGYLWVASRFHTEEDEVGMYLVAATQAVPAPNDGKAWFRTAEESVAEASAPSQPPDEAAPDPPKKR